MTEAVQSDGWMLCIANDITSLRADSRKVRQDRDFAIKASHTDELTGVANRRYVLARIEETIRNVSRSKETSGCLAILDIDKFKQINDRYGHSVGDLILRDFAHTIHRLVRRRDCLGRIGGEEFLVLLPDTQIENAQLIVGRMLSQTSMSRPLQGAPDFSYTFSAGTRSAEAMTPSKPCMVGPTGRSTLPKGPEGTAFIWRAIRSISRQPAPESKTPAGAASGRG